MQLNNLRPAKGSIRPNKRVGRGQGSGRGGTSTRGHKGAKSRSGYSSKRAHEGGQMPLQMRLPKRGFKNSHRRYKSYTAAFTPVNLDMLTLLAEEHKVSTFNLDNMKQLGLTHAKERIKVLARGEAKSALTIYAHAFSGSAREAIKNAGGKTYVVLTLSQVQGVAHATKKDVVTMNDIYTHLGKTAKEGDAVHIVEDEGTLSVKFELQVQSISAVAKAQMESYGGKVTLLDA